jgi:exodeoxyribonuclease V alpha subunit
MAETIQARVVRSLFHKAETGFTVLRCWRDDSGEELKVVGTFPPVQEGELIAVTGEWRNSRWGAQFVAESVAPVMPTTVEEIEGYLVAGHVKGISPKLAKRLVERFGADLWRILDEEPQRLLELPRLRERKLEKIKESWGEHRGIRDTMMFLSAQGVNGARAFRIQKQYGDLTVTVVRENPYRLSWDVDGIGFTTADSIARRLGHDARSPFRLRAGLQDVIDRARREGHCGIPADDARSKSAQLLGVEPALLDETIEAAIAEHRLVDGHVDGRRILFDPVLYRAESRIASALARLANERPKWAAVKPDKALKTAEEEGGMELDSSQEEAIGLALRSRAFAVTGGPGVGKTTLVRALLAVYESNDLRVSLAAPTGRAAKRLSESTGGVALTLHRLLETSPLTGRFQRNEGNTLETDVLIVDEASMVDVPMLDSILKAMPPDAGIVLVGDADQLPSIGPGQVLHDILESGRVPSIRLTEIHRQMEGSDIILNAHRINRGELPVFGSAGAPSDTFLFPADSPEDAVARVVDLVTTRIPKKFGFKSLRDVQVLVPVNKGPIGVHALNAALQEALNPPARHKARVERPNGVFFCPGDKVMQTENNYDKGVFNGDVGILATIEPELERFTVDFGGELIVDYLFDEADQLTLAYATTIHKSQGSEYEAVVIALMRQHGLMLRRNLLYTAVTRGRKLVVMVGDRDAIRKAVRTGRGGERCTRLKQCLAKE